MSFSYKIIIAVLISALVHTLFNSLLPLHPDEAYYWLWSRHIDWSYYDHPGMIAWMIWLFSFLGDSEWAVRTTTVFCMSVACYALSMTAYRACERFDIVMAEKAGWISFLVISIIPASAMGYVFVTPDSPLIMFWCLATYWGYLAISGYGDRYFIATGVAIALMITSKYTAILFPASLFVYILLFDRKLFLHKYTWIACFIGMLGVVPILIWNMQHDWISLKFQYDHGTSSTFTILWGEFFTILGGVQLLPTPIFAYIIYAVSFRWKQYKGERWWQYLTVLFVVPLLFFLYKGMFSKIELNWPIIAFLSAAPLMAVYVSSGHYRKLFRYGAVMAGSLSIMLLISPFVPLPDSINISLRLLGTKEAIMELDKVRKADGLTDPSFFSNHLTNASMMVYYLDGHPDVHIATGTRFSQFNLWDKGVDFSTYSGYYLGNSDKGDELAGIFKTATLVDEIPTGSKTKPKHFYLYRLEGK